MKYMIVFCQLSLYCLQHGDVSQVESVISTALQTHKPEENLTVTR